MTATHYTQLHQITSNYTEYNVVKRVLNYRTFTEHYGTLREHCWYGIPYWLYALRYYGNWYQFVSGKIHDAPRYYGNWYQKFKTKKAPPKRGHRSVSLFDTAEVSQYLIDALKVSLLIESSWKLILSIHEQFFG